MFFLIIKCFFPFATRQVNINYMLIKLRHTWAFKFTWNTFESKIHCPKTLILDWSSSRNNLDSIIFWVLQVISSNGMSFAKFHKSEHQQQFQQNDNCQYDSACFAFTICCVESTGEYLRGYIQIISSTCWCIEIHFQMIVKPYHVSLLYCFPGIFSTFHVRFCF